MFKRICKIIGHKRCRRQARPHGATWRSRCRLCGEKLQRIGPKKWLPLDQLPQADFV